MNLAVAWKVGDLSVNVHSCVRLCFIVGSYETSVTFLLFLSSKILLSLPCPILKIYVLWCKLCRLLGLLCPVDGGVTILRNVDDFTRLHSATHQKTAAVSSSPDVRISKLACVMWCVFIKCPNRTSSSVSVVRASERLWVCDAL